MKTILKWFGKKKSDNAIENQSVINYRGIDHRDFERDVVGLKYTTLDELSPEDRDDIVLSASPVKDAMKKVVRKMLAEPFGVPGLTDTTKFDGNLAQQFPRDNTLRFGNPGCSCDNYQNKGKCSHILETTVYTFTEPGTYVFNGTVTSSTLPLPVNFTSEGKWDEQ